MFWGCLILFLAVYKHVNCADTELFYPSSLLDAENWTLPEESRLLLEKIDAPIVPILLMGVSRSGKSLLLNLMARFLIEAGYVQIPSEQENLFNKGFSVRNYPFGVSAEMTRCTVGINAIILKRKSGGVYLLIDAEGSDNGNRKIVSKILGIGRHLTNLLVFTDDNRFDRALDALGRLIAYGYTSSGQVISAGDGDSKPVSSAQHDWPSLMMVLNKVLETLPDDDMAFFRDQISHKVDDDEPTNELRKMIRESFQSIAFHTLPHNETIKRLIEQQGQSTMVQLTSGYGNSNGYVDMSNALTKKDFMIKFLSLAVQILERTKPLMVKSVEGSQLEVPMDGWMLAAHIQQLLLKSKNITFPATNYLKQIFESVCDNVAADTLSRYQKFVVLEHLSHDEMYLYDSVDEVKLVSSRVQTEIIREMKLLSDHYGGCEKAVSDVQNHMEKDLQVLLRLFVPVGSRLESKYMVVSQWDTERAIAVSRSSNKRSHAPTQNTDAPTAPPVTSSASNGMRLFNLPHLALFQVLKSFLPSSSEDVTYLVETYQSASVEYREITILGNKREVPSAWVKDTRVLDTVIPLSGPGIIVGDTAGHEHFIRKMLLKTREYECARFTIEWRLISWVYVCVLTIIIAKITRFSYRIIGKPLDMLILHTGYTRNFKSLQVTNYNSVKGSAKIVTELSFKRLAMYWCIYIVSTALEVLREIDSIIGLLCVTAVVFSYYSAYNWLLRFLAYSGEYISVQNSTFTGLLTRFSYILLDILLGPDSIVKAYCSLLLFWFNKYIIGLLLGRLTISDVLVLYLDVLFLSFIFFEWYCMAWMCMMTVVSILTAPRSKNYKIIACMNDAESVDYAALNAAIDFDINVNTSISKGASVDGEDVTDMFGRYQHTIFSIPEETASLSSNTTANSRVNSVEAFLNTKGEEPLTDSTVKEDQTTTLSSSANRSTSKNARHSQPSHEVNVKTDSDSSFGDSAQVMIKRAMLMNSIRHAGTSVAATKPARASTGSRLSGGGGTSKSGSAGDKFLGSLGSSRPIGGHSPEPRVFSTVVEKNTTTASEPLSSKKTIKKLIESL